VILFKLFIKDKTAIAVMGELEVQQYPVVWDLDKLSEASDDLRDDLYLNDDDNHTAIVHAHMWQSEAFRDRGRRALSQLVTSKGSIVRRYPDETAWYPVSGDCLSSWVFAAVLTQFKDPKVIHKVADHYIKSSFGLQHYNAKVSARCSNGGLNLCFDAWPVKAKWWPFKYGFIQPALGPQLLTTLSILALAAKSGNLLKRTYYETMYYSTFMLFQGPLFLKWPIVHTKKDLFYYTQHVSMMNLYSLYKITGSKMYLKTMKTISEDLSPHGNINPFFYALRYDCGDLSETKKHKAEEILKRMPSWNGFMWQEIPDEYNYFQKERPSKHHNNVGGFVARLFRR